jgi:hypothetical protein
VTQNHGTRMAINSERSRGCQVKQSRFFAEARNEVHQKQALWGEVSASSSPEIRDLHQTSFRSLAACIAE